MIAMIRESINVLRCAKMKMIQMLLGIYSSLAHLRVT